jgi:hypothetical protein
MSTGQAEGKAHKHLEIYISSIRLAQPGKDSCVPSMHTTRVFTRQLMVATLTTSAHASETPIRSSRPPSTSSFGAHFRKQSL